MPRSRLLKPGFFSNAALGQLSAHHRLLFAGLWTLADRDGRLLDEPARIRAAVFPYEHDLDVDRMLADLVRARFVQRYTIRYKNLRTRARALQIVAFAKHQTPNVREPASAIPPPLPVDSLSRRRTRLGSCAHETRTIPAHANSPVPVPVPEAVPEAGTVPVPEAVDVRTKSSPAKNAGRAPAHDDTTTADEPDAATANMRVITRIAHEAIDVLGTMSPDLDDAIKTLCATRHVTYDSSTVTAAIASARVQRSLRATGVRHES